METIPAGELDAWLRAGGTVVAASERAARAVRTAYHRARRREGLAAWTAPDVLDWSGFVRRAWDQRSMDGRLVLNGQQEQWLWARILAESGQTDGWLDGPRRRLAELAVDAQGLLSDYAAEWLRPAARSNWQQDAGAFSQWLAAFDELCEQNGLVSASRLPLELLSMLEKERGARPPLVLAGFDRVLPVQQRLFDAWGECRSIEPRAAAAEVHSYVAANESFELAACARWCKRKLDQDWHARLLVVTPDASQSRGEIERAFLKCGSDRQRLFEFSLGVPLSQVGVARAALLLLRWLDGTIEEHQLDWLVASGFAAASAEERAALEAYMRALRRRGLQRVHWTMDAFLRQPAALASPLVMWEQRMRAAEQLLRKAVRSQSPLDWAAQASQLLEAAGWPGGRPLTSAEFQAASRWRQALDLCGSLGFDGRRLTWNEFVAELERTAGEILFAEETEDAPIVIAGPSESAGLTADAIWFLGADEDAWPAAGSSHPLIPIDVQREAGMPHATPQLDWDLAEAVTARLLASAPEVCFSYARQREDVETRPSRVVVQHAGAPQPLPAELAPESSPEPRTIAFQDAAAIALPTVAAKRSTAQLSLFDDAGTQREPIAMHEVPGGSTVLTAQSQCGFKAFATARLGAQGWEPAQAGLTAPERGQLLHAVLHAVWGPKGIRTSDQLHAMGADLRPFVEGHVRQVLEEEMPPGAREQMPARYLELEEARLTRLVTEWLEYERGRAAFEVEATERDAIPAVAGLTLKLRLDRVDRLNDGSLLVIDYKSGNVSPKSWELPRPDDVQLPLYAGFALPADQKLGGLVFAKVRAGEQKCFDGRIANAQATLHPDLKGNSGLVKNALTLEQLSAWKRAIEDLARDFIAGRADVDPRDYPTTCENCGLFTLCRVREREDQREEEDDDRAAEVGNE